LTGSVGVASAAGSRIVAAVYLLLASAMTGASGGSVSVATGESRLPPLLPVVAAGPAETRPVIDTNPDPRVLETTLVAEETAVDLDGRGLMATMYTLNGGTPGPEFRVRVGDRVIVHFTNRIAEPLMIHWHGIELYNASDGTTLTQNPLRKGESFTYDFLVTRPGVFWYHSHRAPTNPEFKGMYGPFIVTDDADDELVRRRVLPDAAHTRTLMLGDTTVCKAPGRNDAATFPADPSLPWSFTRAGLGPFPGNAAYPTPRDLCEDPRDDHGMPLGTGALPAGAVPNVQPSTKCGLNPKCRVAEGQLVLVNGRVPAPRAGSPDAPGELADRAAALPVRSGEALRLRLVNGAVSRYFRLRLSDAKGRLVPLVRVGGQGGLLDRARVEGGLLGKVDTKSERGELVLAPADRADVVLTVPEAARGDVLTLWTEDYSHYGTNEYPYGYGGLPSVPVAHFEVTGRARGSARLALAEGAPLRAHPAIDAPVASLKAQPVTGHLLDPARFDPPLPGTPNEELLLTVLGLRESIDGIHATALHGSDGDYRSIPHLPSSRYARVGDLLELTFRNGTQQHHPLHLHGFSFQPLRILDTDGNSVYEYDYNEFVDTVDIPDLRAVVVRVRLDDRSAPGSRLAGGALGRWFIHCHIFNHAELGMMAELVVLPR
jgi:FtsP/CotA-like multicopper oxidase with cupredoxin domain